MSVSVNTFSRFWTVNDFSKVHIVCSSIPREIWPYYAKIGDRNYLRYAKYADLDSLIHVKTEIARTFPRTEVIDLVDQEDIGLEFQNLIALGGPSWNQRTRNVQKKLPFWIEEMGEGIDDVVKLKDIKGLRKKTYQPEWSSEQNLIRDVSIVTRIKINKNSCIFIFCGCLTHGVLGAVKSVLNFKTGYQNAKYLADNANDNDLAAIFYSQNLGSEIVPPNFEEAKDFLLLIQSKQNGKLWNIAQQRGLM